MSKQPTITAFFGSRKRRAPDTYSRESKLLKYDPTLLKAKSIVNEEVKGTIQVVSSDVPFPEVEESKLLKCEPTLLKANPVVNDKVKRIVEAVDSDVAFSEVKEPKLLKPDPTLLKAKPILNEKLKEIIVASDIAIPAANETTETLRREPVTPRKKTCDIRSYMTSQSPYRPECSKVVTPVKLLQLDGKLKSQSTPFKTPECPILKKISDLPCSSVKKSIRFEDDVGAVRVHNNTVPEPVDTDDLIKAANDLVEKLKTKSRSISSLASDGKKSKGMTSVQLKKKLAKTAKLAELKSSLSRLGKQASELIQLEKKNQDIVAAPKLTKFESIEIQVQKSPHKGALSSPVKSPAKPAYERFAHLIERTPAPGTSLPLPFGFQRLLELFTATDTICSLMMNRGELITFKKLKPSVQELTRKNFTERHLGQILAVLPNSFTLRMDKVRNFGSTSKVEKYDLVLTPLLHVNPMINTNVADRQPNIIRMADLKKMGPKMLQKRKEDFHTALLTRTMDKHEEFLASLDPPIQLSRNQLTRWHPNFPLDMVPDVPPTTLPEVPNMQKPATAREILDRSQQLLSSNERVRNALGIAARTADAITAGTDNKAVSSTPLLDKESKERIDQKLAVHDPLKGISKSLLEKIRAKQAAKALEAMRMSPSDEKELMLLTQLPDTARIVRTLFIDGQKGVFPWVTVVDKIQLSCKRTVSKGEVERVLRRLVEEVPEWLAVFSIKNVEYLKSNRAVTFAPLMDKLEKMVAEKRGQLC